MSLSVLIGAGFLSVFLFYINRSFLFRCQVVGIKELAIAGMQKRPILFNSGSLGLHTIVIVVVSYDSSDTQYCDE